MFQGKLVQTQIYIIFYFNTNCKCMELRIYILQSAFSYLYYYTPYFLSYSLSIKKHKVSHLPPVRCHTLGCGSLSSLCFPGLYGPINQNQKHFIQTIILKYTYFLYLIFSDEKFLHVMQIKKLW